MPSSGTRLPAPVERYYPVLAAAVLALAAFNLTFRLGSEIVTEWDESLYAISASEMVRSGHWIATTFMGTPDYYNTKPPLNIWLISMAFKAFGASLSSLRLTSVISAWLTVAVFQYWVRRALGAAIALVGSLVLATTFGFIYDHSGRSGNTDALFTLLVLLTVITLWAAETRPWRLAWLGPIAAAVFLLRGMAVLMPVSIVVLVEWWRVARSYQHRWRPLATSLVLFAVPVTAWMVARWRFDGWRFISATFTYDFAARALTVIEDHPGTPLYYLNILQRNQFDWLFAGLMMCAVCAVSRGGLLKRAAFWRTDDRLAIIVGSWTLITLLIPTLMRTKLSWYLNTFYPPFALGIAWLFVRGFSDDRRLSAAARRHAVVLALFLMAFVTAEFRLLWYSYHRRALANSSQGMLLTERHRLAGHRVYGNHWTHSEVFVLNGIVGAEQHESGSLEDFLRDSRSGDYYVSSPNVDRPEVLLVRSLGPHSLYRRRE
jgi:4-amino-4-deoxy-L-arabinose transferase-like glycosyltransferase